MMLLEVLLIFVTSFRETRTYTEHQWGVSTVSERSRYLRTGERSHRDYKTDRLTEAELSELW